MCKGMWLFLQTSPNPRLIYFQLMGGRYFGGTQVVAYVSDGSEKFKKTNERRAALEDLAEGRDPEEEAERLEEFGSWLESQRESERVVENSAR
jgi:HIV Tat-specific factor 1